MLHAHCPKMDLLRHLQGVGSPLPASPLAKLLGTPASGSLSPGQSVAALLMPGNASASPRGARQHAGVSLQQSAHTPEGYGLTIYDVREDAEQGSSQQTTPVATYSAKPGGCTSGSLVFSSRFFRGYTIGSAVRILAQADANLRCLSKHSMGSEVTDIAVLESDSEKHPQEVWVTADHAGSVNIIVTALTAGQVMSRTVASIVVADSEAQQSSATLVRWHPTLRSHLFLARGRCIWLVDLNAAGVPASAFGMDDRADTGVNGQQQAQAHADGSTPPPLWSSAGLRAISLALDTAAATADEPITDFSVVSREAPLPADAAAGTVGWDAGDFLLAYSQPGCVQLLTGCTANDGMSPFATVASSGALVGQVKLVRCEAAGAARFAVVAVCSSTSTLLAFTLPTDSATRTLAASSSLAHHAYTAKQNQLTQALSLAGFTAAGKEPRLHISACSAGVAGALVAVADQGTPALVALHLAPPSTADISSSSSGPTFTSCWRWVHALHASLPNPCYSACITPPYAAAAYAPASVGSSPSAWDIAVSMGEVEVMVHLVDGAQTMRMQLNDLLLSAAEVAALEPAPASAPTPTAAVTSSTPMLLSPAAIAVPEPAPAPAPVVSAPSSPAPVAALLIPSVATPISPSPSPASTTPNHHHHHQPPAPPATAVSGRGYESDSEQSGSSGALEDGGMASPAAVPAAAAAAVLHAAAVPAAAAPVPPPASVAAAAAPVPEAATAAATAAAAPSDAAATASTVLRTLAWQMQNDAAKREARASNEMAGLLQAISGSLQRDVPALIRDAVQGAMDDQLATIAETLDASYDHLHDKMLDVVTTQAKSGAEAAAPAIVASVEVAVKSAVQSAVTNAVKAASKGLPNDVKAAAVEAFRAAFIETLLPAFERAAAAMVSQLSSRIEGDFKAVADATAKAADAMAPSVAAVEKASVAVTQAAAQLPAMLEIARVQRDIQTDQARVAAALGQAAASMDQQTAASASAAASASQEISALRGQVSALSQQVEALVSMLQRGGAGGQAQMMAPQPQQPQYGGGYQQPGHMTSVQQLQPPMYAQPPFPMQGQQPQPMSMHMMPQQQQQQLPVPQPMQMLQQQQRPLQLPQQQLPQQFQGGLHQQQQSAPMPFHQQPQVPAPVQPIAVAAPAPAPAPAENVNPIQKLLAAAQAGAKAGGSGASSSLAGLLGAKPAPPAAGPQPLPQPVPSNDAERTLVSKASSTAAGGGLGEALKDVVGAPSLTPVAFLLRWAGANPGADAAGAPSAAVDKLDAFSRLCLLQRLAGLLAPAEQQGVSDAEIAVRLAWLAAAASVMRSASDPSHPQVAPHWPGISSDARSAAQALTTSSNGDVAARAREAVARIV